MTPEYRAWVKMWQRCTNPRNNKYSLYGGRGITICKRWMKFENFYADMGARPPKHSLDRRDNSKGYSKANCRWATPQQQNLNRRQFASSVRYEGMTVAEAAKHHGVSKHTIYRRIYGRKWGTNAPAA